LEYSKMRNLEINLKVNY